MKKEAAWFLDFVNKYKSGIAHTFLFNFNVRDYVDNKRELERYIGDEFLSERKFMAVASYDLSRGLTFPDAAMEREFRKIATNGAPLPPTSLPSRLFPLIDLALASTKFAIFINHAEMLVPAGGTASMNGEERCALIWLCEWSLNARISAVGSLVCLTAGNIAGVAPELLSSSYKVEPILVGLPDEAERLAYIKAQLAQKSVALDISERDFAALSSGLSKKSIRDIMLKAEAEDVPVSFEFIREKKHSVLQKEYGDVLEFIYPETGFEDIGGMEAAKNYLIKNVIEPIRRNDLRRVPMGVLLCGPSGTGKTLLVYALARASGFNCVKIDMSRILGQYVGESEKNFKKCLLGAQSQQPVIVFVDEIDTAFQRGDERDSGVSRNIFSEFLQFTGNSRNRGRVIFIAATNRPDLLDPALKRAGRFDKKIPILIPSRDERAQVFSVLVKKYRFRTDIDDFTIFADKTPGYTGAEIETVLRKAYELACDETPANGTADGAAPANGLTDGGAPTNVPVGAAASAASAATAAAAVSVPIADTCIRAEHLLRAVEKCRPNTGQIEMMTRLAIEECDDDDLLTQGE
ncbi:MAG: ATP-binding protein [Clostridiales bacterium]|jgi:SpoVK/Ycf46/Vps4 family AAA+-type ATPase|nr:ATP-binding protein [Clostridiales bacterium]